MRTLIIVHNEMTCDNVYVLCPRNISNIIHDVIMGGLTSEIENAVPVMFDIVKEIGEVIVFNDCSCDVTTYEVNDDSCDPILSFNVIIDGENGRCYKYNDVEKVSWRF